MTSAPSPSADESEREEDAASFAYRRLRNDILAGRLEPGARLSQVQVARSLGISRTPLREALRRLEVEQLIVGDFNQRMHVSELNLDDFDQIYAMRLALEPLGITRTLPALDDGERAALAGHVKAMSAAIDALDLETFRDEHRAFHLGLTAHSGQRLRHLYAELWDHSERYRLAYLHHDYDVKDSASADRLRLSQYEHADILQAALAGNAASCSDHLTAHLLRTYDAVLAEHRQEPPSLAAASLRRHLTARFRHGE